MVEVAIGLIFTHFVLGVIVSHVNQRIISTDWTLAARARQVTQTQDRSRVHFEELTRSCVRTQGRPCETVHSWITAVILRCG